MFSMNILQINASARVESANSTRIADLITARLRARYPDAQLTVRDLARAPHPVLDATALAALFTPEEQRTPEQVRRVAQDDVLIAELQAADVLVLGVPLYNLGVSVQFKSWIDAVSRVRVTFRYTADGPEGLVRGKKVYVALARGGRYRDTNLDTQTPYLKVILGFLGMTDVHFVYGEGFAMGEEGARQALAEAGAQIDALSLP
jgi:FMN-dependent NADH-azoreductase